MLGLLAQAWLVVQLKRLAVVLVSSLPPRWSAVWLAGLALQKPLTLPNADRLPSSQ